MKKDNRLYISSNDQVIFGVCAGIAHKYNIDPIIVRIIVAVGIFCTPMPVGLVYIIIGLFIVNAKETL